MFEFFNKKKVTPEESEGPLTKSIEEMEEYASQVVDLDEAKKSELKEFGELTVVKKTSEEKEPEGFGEDSLSKEDLKIISREEKEAA